MPDHDDLDRDLERRLTEYESRIPDDVPPGVNGAGGRAAGRSPMAAVAAMVVIVVVAVLLVRPAQPGIEASPTASVRTPTATAPSPAASTSAAALEWGPMAVVDATGDMARTEGTLQISADCVFLERGEERSLLVWPADRARWNDDGTISFATIHGGEITLTSGDYVVMGGGGSSTEEDGMIPQERVDTVPWVHRPSEACLVDGWWFISDVSSIGVPTPTPEPSRAAWVPLPFPADSGEYAGVNGVTEWHGQLVAVGRAGERRGAIWVSDDGATWRPATVPDSPPELAVSLQAPFVVDERLFVIGITFYPAGSGPVGSVIWTSTDGLTWTDTAASAQFPGNPLGLIGIRGQTIVASEGHETPAGSAFWVSNDAGDTWQRSAVDLDGSRAVDGLVHDGAFFAVGSARDSTAMVWNSTDGLAWTPTELGPGYASRIAKLPDGTLLVVGGVARESDVAALGWTSTDGREWTPSGIDLACCGTEFDVMPSGIVVVQRAEDGSVSTVSTSRDGLTWSVDGPLAGDMRGVTWTEAFGVVIWGVDPNGRPSVVLGWEAE